MHDCVSAVWAARAAVLSLATAARSSLDAVSEYEPVSFAQDSLLPLGGSYLLSVAASSTYSLVWGWIVSHAGGSVCNSWPILLVNDSGPLVSLVMTWRMGVDGPGIPGGPPIMPGPI